MERVAFGGRIERVISGSGTECGVTDGLAECGGSVECVVSGGGSGVERVISGCGMEFWVSVGCAEFVVTLGCDMDCAVSGGCAEWVFTGGIEEFVVSCCGVECVVSVAMVRIVSNSNTE